MILLTDLGEIELREGKIIVELPVEENVQVEELVGKVMANHMTQRVRYLYKPFKGESKEDLDE